ncbi:MAG: gamma carbonic anhydrase family protein [Alphaproteobacteria bacterium]|nr:gamma carbonic anhydrase family protein [Alphaproteobacteria bacterium]
MQGLIMPFKGRMPKLGQGVFIAPTAAVIGDVEIGDDSSLWFGVTVRADVHEVRIGSNTNIQDGSVVHVTGGKFGTYIGSNVTIGHGAIIHACTLEDGAFVGMGAIILDGAVVEGGSMVAAGAVVTPGKRVKRGEMWAGSPAKLLRTISEDEIKAFAWSAPHYVDLKNDYLAQARTR